MAVYRYGFIGDEGCNDLLIELKAFLLVPSEDVGGLGKAEHFWNCVSILWPEKIDGKKNPNAFIRNPWAERMAVETVRRPVLAVLGPLNSNKSDFYAVWGIVSWLADPWNTMVLLTSTSLGDSKRKMWSSVKKYFQAVPKLPGRLIDSKGAILTDDGSGRSSDKCGIILIAGEKKKEKEAVGKLIGMKMFTGTLLFICDELPELSPALNEAFFSNLQPSNPKATMVGIGNFNSIYDALGTLSEPIGGWGSVSPDDEEWECVRGAYCIRFDGMKSPNLLLGEDKYPFLYSSRSLAKHREAYGENSAPFWRMCRSFPCPEGDVHVLFSEADFIKGKAHEPPVWLTEPVTVIGADPAFTNDGDNFSVVIGQYGKNQNGLPILAIKEYRYLRENMALTKSGEARDIQTARLLVEVAREFRVAPENVAVDTSGPGGLAFGSILSTIWGSNRFLGVKFGEAPTKRQVSENDPKRCDEAYFNKVTEIWATGVQFVRAGQIKNLPSAVARELKSRQFKTVKGVSMKMCVESKTDMKARTGFSPDLGEGFLITLDLCRERFGFTPGAMNGQVFNLPQSRNKRWLEYARRVHSVYEPENMYAKVA